ncbi:indole-3-glycerol phosphate synthase [Desulfofundulus luciae]|uniref:Indole-3-glycerol phosphate synthase n=1 Tax=Desulfofundulus luciae TaxID=74702 RepID=A0ABU0AYZ8_9FIRM|nr:indole-3-glycerol phosphate synthase TrpC [Desulfofundulus luciae]MDQ0285692.1 indole-3-glycerol phosphate synthase [Desulfofundulus luciae]
MILEKIIAHKHREIQSRREMRPLSRLIDRVQALGPTRPLGSFLRRPGKVTLIAEIKRASPSKGWLVKGMKPVETARIYTRAGAAAISILTDNRFFRGHRAFLPLVRRESPLPLLCKDFIIDPYQIYEARCLGADAVLLIVAALNDRQLTTFQALAGELGMSCLVEVHTAEELERARASGATIIGINNRNLHTFSTDLSTTFRLREKITDPGVVVVSESGINSREDMLALARCRVDAALVGEALVRAGDVERKVKELLGEGIVPW